MLLWKETKRGRSDIPSRGGMGEKKEKKKKKNGACKKRREAGKGGLTAVCQLNPATREKKGGDPLTKKESRIQEWGLQGRPPTFFESQLEIGREEFLGTRKI